MMKKIIYKMDQKNIEILKRGGVGVIPTDTIYGLVGSALSFEAVNRISKIKNRTDGKGFIVLISSIEDLSIFGISVSEKDRIFLNKYWPGKVSFKLFSDLSKYEYLRQADNTNAFRLPDNSNLLQLLKEVGPLVAPSANPEGLAPAKNIIEAQKYFGLPTTEGDRVDFYEDGGDLNSLPSTLVRINGDNIEILRQGAVKID
jgi:L-threonylcarbamoyladenylate synthase